MSTKCAKCKARVSRGWLQADMSLLCDACHAPEAELVAEEFACGRCGKTHTGEGIHVSSGFGGATKHDREKIPLELLPVESLEEIAKVLAFGQAKYDSWNWSKGFQWSRLFGACLRHLFAYMRGENKDPESGLSHLAHAGCCILFLIYHEKYFKDKDDRHVRPTI